MSEQPKESVMDCPICQRTYPADMMHQVGAETWICPTCNYDPYPLDWFEDDDYVDPFDLDAHPIQCAVCGGEVGESWATCDCEDGPTQY